MSETATAARRPRVAIVLKGYPRLSETFIAQEILGLKRLGAPVHLVSLRWPTDEQEHPVHAEIAEVPNYLPEYLYQEPLRLVRSWVKARRLPGYRAARRLFLADWRRDRTLNRGRRWGQALVLAAEMPADIGLIYAHFLHTPGSVARYAGRMLDVPFAVSAHAKDIWTIPDWEKREKLGDLAFLVTCTGANATHLQALAPAPERVSLVYHGLDFARFPPPPAGAEPSRRDGLQAGDPVRLLSVGRFVDKKGHAGLLDALAHLKDLHWRLELVGGGPLKEELRAAAERLGIADRVTIRAAMAQGELLQRYRAADLFVLNSRISDDGDRDGLPNVLMEAQSQRLACLSTCVSAVPEILRDGETGVLVPPDDAPALAGALRRLVADPALRARLGSAGETYLRAHFGHAGGVEAVFRRIRTVLGR